MLLLSELSGWLPSLSFVIYYLILHHIELSVCLNFLTVRDQFSAISICLNFLQIMYIDFHYFWILFCQNIKSVWLNIFCLITFSNYQNFLFIMICGLCRVSGGFLKFRLLTNALHPCLVANVFSISWNCWMRSIFCHLFWVWIAWWLAVVKSRTLTKSR